MAERLVLDPSATDRSSAGTVAFLARQPTHQLRRVVLPTGREAHGSTAVSRAPVAVNGLGTKSTRLVPLDGGRTSDVSGRTDNRDTTRDVLRTLGLDTDEYANLLRVTPNAVERFSRGQLAPATGVRPRMRPYITLALRLNATFDRQDVPRWLTAPNRYLHGRTPAAVIRAGDVASVLGAIDALEWGIYA